MARYVIVIQLTPNPDGILDPDDYFSWEVRDLIGDSSSGDILERSGPTLVSGTAPDVTTAKHVAETWTERLAQQTVYIYNTTTQEPTPLPTPPAP